MSSFASAAGAPRRSAAFEIGALRTSTSATFLNPDDSYTTRVYAHPVHFRDGRGGWRKISTVLGDSTRPGFAFANKTNSFSVDLADEAAGGEGLLRYDAGQGVAFTLRLEGAAAGVRAQKEGASQLRFGGVLPSTDLAYALLADGVKESLILNAADAPSEFRFVLTPVGSDDLRAVAQSDGSVAFFSKGGGEPVFTLQAPVVSESTRPATVDEARARLKPENAGAPPPPPSASFPVVGGAAIAPGKASLGVERRPDGSFAVTVRVDAQWLRASERVFPVVVDPTITKQADVLDGTYDVRNGANLPDMSSAELGIGDDGSGANFKSAVTFNLSALPPGARITAAHLNLFFSSCFGSCGWFWPGTSGTIELHRLTSGWTSTTPWGSITRDGTVLASRAMAVWWAGDQPGRWETLEAPALVSALQSMTSGSLPNYGFLLENAGTGYRFSSSRYADIERTPRLEMEWVADAASLADPAHLHANGAELSWSHYNGGLGPYGQAVLADAPLAYWRLDDPPDSPFGIADWTGSGHHATGNGSLGYGAAGATADGDQSLSFGGAGFVESPANAAFSSLADTFSAEAWVRRGTTASGRYTILSRGNDPDGGGGFRLNINPSDRLELQQGDLGTTLVTSTTTIGDTSWHHVAATKSGALVRLYIDGIDRTGSVSNVTLSHGITNLDVGANPHYDGANWVHNDYFNGSIDEVAVWSTALSQAQIQAHVTAAAQSLAGFLRYEVHRSTTSNFTPSASTLLATLTDSAAQTYRDTTARPATTFYYRVVTTTSSGSYSSGPVRADLPAAGQAQVTLQAGIAGADANATSITSGNSCANQGGAQTLPIDSTNRALLKFDLRPIPTGATVTSATLSLFTFSTAAATLSAHSVKADWSEGASSSPACDSSGATWAERTPNVAWAASGGDYDSAAAATIASSGGAPRFDSANVTSAISARLGGQLADQGFLIKHATETGAPTFAYVSDDYATSLALRPKLVVSYSDSAQANGPSVGVSVPARAPAGVAPLVTGTTTVSAGASDDGRVESVQFKLDGANLGSGDSTAPYSVSWDTTTAPRGARVLTAVATDDAGNQTTSEPLTVVVANSSAPTVSVSSDAAVDAQPDVPVGAVVPFAGTTIPSGWLEADGSAVSRTTYGDLFAAEGTSFGAGDGTTTFNLPDLRGRLPLGQTTAGTGSILGATGGTLNMGGGTINLPQISLSFTTPAVGYTAGAVAAATPSFSFPGVNAHYNYWGQDAEPYAASVGSGGGLSSGWTTFTMPAQTATSGSLTPTASLSTASAPYRVLRYIVKATASAAIPTCAVWPSAAISTPSGSVPADGSAASGALAACLATEFSGNTPDLRGRFPFGRTASGTLSTLNATGGSRDFTHSASRSVPSASVSVPNYTTSLTVPAGSYPVTYSWWRYGGGNGADVWTMVCAGYGSGGSNNSSVPTYPSPNNACMPANATTPAVATPNASGGGAGPYSTQTVNDSAATGSYNPAFLALGYVTGTLAGPAPGIAIPFASATVPTGWMVADGACLSQTTYATLYAAIGTTYGGCPAGQFKLPNLRGRFPLGQAISGTGSVLGAAGGSLDLTPSASLPNFTTTFSWTPSNFTFSVPARQATVDLGSSSNHEYGGSSQSGWGWGGVITSSAFGATSFTASPTSPGPRTVTSAAAGATTATFAAENPPYQVLNYLINSGTTITVGGNVGTINVTADASDDNAVTKIDFLVDGRRYASDSTAPYTATLNTSNAGVYNGNHQLTAIAYDADGNSTTSSATGFTVDGSQGGTAIYKASISDSPALPTEMRYDPDAANQDAAATTVSLANNSGQNWSAATVNLRYRWLNSDGSEFSNSGNLALSGDIADGGNGTVAVTVQPPAVPSYVQRSRMTLRFDLYDTACGCYFASKGSRPLNQTITVTRAQPDELGLERYQQYDGVDLGTHFGAAVNLGNGNLVVTSTLLSLPGRGLNTTATLTYNSEEVGAVSPVGNGWSLAVSGVTPLGLPLDIHPNAADTAAGRTAKWIGFTDSDGSYHRFDGRTVGSNTIYDPPPGVHLYLRPSGSNWLLTRPDRTTYSYDSNGYPTQVSDKGGNTLTFAYAASPSDPYGLKQLTSVTDAGGRAVTLTYYAADEPGVGMRGKLKTLTDHVGHLFRFAYYDDGNLLKVVEEGGSNVDGSYLADRVVTLTYTNAAGDAPAITSASARQNPDPMTSQGTRLYSVIDARGNETSFAYITTGTAQGRLSALTPRSGSASTTNYSYNIASATTTVAQPLGRTWGYVFDNKNRLTSFTDPLNQTTTVAWTTDNAVQQVTEPTGKYVEYAYNANGYLTDNWDELRNHTTIGYENLAVDGNDVSGNWETGRTIAHLSRITSVVAPVGNATTSNPNDYKTSFDYTNNTNDRVYHVTDPLGNQTTNTYNADGTLASTTLPNNGDGITRTTTINSYDPNGLPNQITDAANGIVRASYDANGKTIWTQDANHGSYTGGDPTQYRSYTDYDTYGRPGRTGTPKSSKYQPGLLIWSDTGYDANDNITKTLSSHYGAGDSGVAPQTSTSFDAMDRPTTTTGPRASADGGPVQTTTTYDAAGRVASTTNPNGVKTAPSGSLWTNDFMTESSYDLLDRPSAVSAYAVDATGAIDPAQTRTTSYCYDKAGDLRSLTAPKGRAAFTAAGACPAATLPANYSYTTAGYTTKFEYDDAHRQLKQIAADSTFTTTAYNPNGAVTSSTDQNNKTTTNTYDDRGQLTTTVTPFDGARTLTAKWEYNALGTLKRYISPRAYDYATGGPTFTSYVESYSYDALARLVKTTLPNASGETQAYTYTGYDANGNRALVSLPSAQTSVAGLGTAEKTTVEYWDTGAIYSSQDPANPKVRFDYTPEGWQASRIPETTIQPGTLDFSRAMFWDYHPDGLLRALRDLGGERASYTYDANGNQTSATEATGLTQASQTPLTIQNSYDGFDQLTKTRAPKPGASGTWLATLYAYDLHGLTSQLTDNREENTAGSQTAVGRVYTYAYDNVDRPATQTDDFGTSSNGADDEQVTYSYAPTGALSMRTLSKANGGGWTQEQKLARTFFDNGLLKQLTNYDGSNAIIEQHDLLYINAAIYANGNRISDTFKLKNADGGTTCWSATCTASWTYDARNRLVQEAVSGTNQTTNFTLDPIGNVTQETNGSSTTTKTYAGQQLSSLTTSAGTTRYLYDSSGNLDCIVDSSWTGSTCPAAGNATLLTDYVYDYKNRLANERQYTGGALTDSADYVNDPLDRPVSETENHSGSVTTTQFTYRGVSDALSRETLSGAANATKSYSYDALGARIAIADTPNGGATTRYSYLNDPHGSTSLLIDQNNMIKASYRYSAYGGADAALTKTAPGFNAATNVYRYSGKRLDAGSGTYDMGARRYSPAPGRFVQQDIYYGALANLGLATDSPSANRYAFTGANPINFVEIDGHRAWESDEVGGYAGCLCYNTQPQTPVAGGESDDTTRGAGGDIDGGTPDAGPGPDTDGPTRTVAGGAGGTSLDPRDLLEKLAAKLHIHVSGAELKYCVGGPIKHYFACYDSFVLVAGLTKAVFAWAEQNVWGPHYDPTNSMPDAFLHSVYAAIITLRHGAEFAKALTDAHEAGASGDGELATNARIMDLHNNAVGIALGRAWGALDLGGKDPTDNPFTNNLTESIVWAGLFGESMVGAKGSRLWVLGPPGATYDYIHDHPDVYSIGTGKRIR